MSASKLRAASPHCLLNVLTSSEIERSSWKSGGVLLCAKLEGLTYQCACSLGRISVKKVSEAKDLRTKTEDSCLKHEKFGGMRREMG